MHSIALTRYTLARFQKADRQRCQESYARVKHKQAELTARSKYNRYRRGDANQVLCRAATSFRGGLILQKYNLFGLAADQFERALQLLMALE